MRDQEKYTWLTLEKLRELMSYDPHSGELTRLVTMGGRLAGEVLGCPSHNGYLKVVIGRRTYFAHILAWFHYYGEWPKGPVDHINHNTADNAISNLRIVTPAENVRHTRLTAANRSGAKGVMLTRNGRFKAQIKYDGKTHHLGQFGSLDEGAHAYNKAAIAAFGEFAVINPIGVDKPLAQQAKGELP